MGQVIIIFFFVFIGLLSFTDNGFIAFILAPFITIIVYILFKSLEAQEKKELAEAQEQDRQQKWREFYAEQDRQQKLAEEKEQRKIKFFEEELQNIQYPCFEQLQSFGNGEIEEKVFFIDETEGILQKNFFIITDLLLNRCEEPYPPFETFVPPINEPENPQMMEIREKAKLKYQQCQKIYEEHQKKEKRRIENIILKYQEGEKDGVEEYFSLILSYIAFPQSVSLEWKFEYHEKEKILIAEIRLPEVVHNKPMKLVLQKNGYVQKFLNKQETKEEVPKIHPALMLRIATELFENDTDEQISFLALNGWVLYDDLVTGKETKATVASLGVKKDEILDLVLEKVDPLLAFQNLKGISAGRAIDDIVAIKPQLKIAEHDSRFVEAKPVIDAVNMHTNLATIDWQDFEFFIRELFEKIFSADGGEVKVTQASRDRGVDAIVFYPDPIKGGKYVIQAKRYTNTVDVSAVRDLDAVVRKENALKGILVTTSSFGSDSYEFVRNNTPIELINGQQLLGLLEKHGYQFKIDLEEAKKLNSLKMETQRGEL